MTVTRIFNIPTTWQRLLFVVVDYFAAVIATMHVLFFPPAGHIFSARYGIPNAFFIGLIFLILMQMCEGYRFDRMVRFGYHLRAVGRGIVAGGMVYVLYCLIVPSAMIPLRSALMWFLDTGVLSVLGRIVAVLALKRDRMLIRVIILGAGWAGREIAQALVDRSEHGLTPIGFIDDTVTQPPIEGIPVLGQFDQVHITAISRRTDLAVMAITHDRRAEVTRARYELERRGIPVIEMPDLYEQIMQKVPVRHLVNRKELFEPAYRNGWKKLFDRFNRLVHPFIAALLLILLSPFLLLLALAIAIDSRGPVFYLQERTGHLNRSFKIIKFRSMTDEAESTSGPVWASQDDPRITRVGRFMRQLRLDELPQLLNVIKGDLNLVGPRPERPEFVQWLADEIPFYNERHLVMPGITGWAQTNHPYGNTLEDALEKLQYDLYYIKYRGLMFDLIILFKTVAVVAARRGT